MVVVVITLCAISCVEAEKAEQAVAAEPVEATVAEVAAKAVATDVAKADMLEVITEDATAAVVEVVAEKAVEAVAVPEKAEVVEKSTDLATVQQQVGYSIGTQIGNDFRRNEFDIDSDSFIRGFTDAFSGKELVLSEEKIAEVLAAFRLRMQATQKKKVEDMAKTGMAFLEENKKKEGVVALSSGLQYKVLRAGTGATPKASDTVSTNYRGTLVDGTEFDSSYKRGKPADFPVKGVIKGWTEALQLMKVGAKWELYIPPSIAYGQRGSRTIPPNATLIFELELLDIKAPKQAASPKVKPVTIPNFKVPPIPK